jgi:hypothetical protein
MTRQRKTHRSNPRCELFSFQRRSSHWPSRRPLREAVGVVVAFTVVVSAVSTAAVFTTAVSTAGFTAAAWATAATIPIGESAGRIRMMDMGVDTAATNDGRCSRRCSDPTRQRT